MNMGLAVAGRSFFCWALCLKLIMFRTGYDTFLLGSLKLIMFCMGKQDVSGNSCE